MKTYDKVVSALFLFIMFIAVWIWVVSANGWTFTTVLASVFCLALFVWTGLRAIPALTGYILSPGAAGMISTDNLQEERQQTWWKIVVWVVLSRLLLIFIVYMFWLNTGGASGGLWSQIMDVWHLRGIDSPAYLGIAERGYVTEGDPRFHIVFLPLFPVIIKVMHFFTGEYVIAGFIVANLCTIAAALFAYELARLDLERRNALRVVKYIFVFPSAFFFFIPMTESLFLLLSLMALYYVRKKRWLLGCLCAALAGFTRSPGILLAVPIAVEFARSLAASYRYKGRRRVFTSKLMLALGCLVTVSFGLLAYLYINYRVTGNAFQFSIYQREHWSQRLYFFFDTVRYQMVYAINTFKEGDYRSFLGLWLPNLSCIFLVLLMMFKSAKKLNPAYMAYFIVYFIYVVGPTWLLSAPRYFAVAFPLAFAAVLLTEDKRKDVALTSFYIVGSLLYLAVFLSGYPVY